MSAADGTFTLSCPPTGTGIWSSWPRDSPPAMWRPRRDPTGSGWRPGMAHCRPTSSGCRQLATGSPATRARQLAVAIRSLAGGVALALRRDPVTYGARRVDHGAVSPATPVAGRLRSVANSTAGPGTRASPRALARRWRRSGPGLLRRRIQRRPAADHALSRQLPSYLAAILSTRASANALPMGARIFAAPR
jgi:hypothetical protein